MCLVYTTKPDARSSRDVLAMLRDLYSKRPETRTLEPYALRGTLWFLRYTDKLLHEDEIAAAVEVARSDFDPDEGAA